MNKVIQLMMAPVCMGVLGLAASANGAEKAPNIKKPKAIVLIYADDLGYGDVGCYGSKKIPTPAIDSLAKQGMKCTNAYATTAMCTPSRFAMMTGMYPWRQANTNILPGDAALIIDTNKPTLPKLLQQNGYTTGIFGKWHLGMGKGKIDWNKEIDHGPKEVGFDKSYMMAATGDRVPCVYIKDGKVVNGDPNDPIEVSYQKPFPGELIGKDVDRSKLKQNWSHGHNQAIIDGVGRIGFMTGGKKAVWSDETKSDILTDEAVKFIKENAKANKPFFMYYAAHDIHVPRVVAKRFQGKSPCGPRGDSTLQFDDSVQRILKAIKQSGLENDTLVILSSDNGPVLDDGYQDQARERNGDHKPAGPYRAGKYSIYEGGTRMPFIVRWPKVIPAGTTSGALMNQMDLAATFEAMFAGKAMDANGKSQFPDSENVFPAWTNPKTEARDYMISSAGHHILAIRHKNWKYIPPNTPMRDGINGGGANMSKAPAEGALFDVEKDPYESTNLAAQHPDICKQLQEKLQEIKAKKPY